MHKVVTGLSTDRGDFTAVSPTLKAPTRWDLNFLNMLEHVEPSDLLRV